MKTPGPILVAHLFPELLDALLDLLGSLSAEQWQRPTACAGWSVKDVAAHLLGGDVGVLSRQRDGYRPSGAEEIRGWDDLVALINRLNAQWVAAAGRLSPRLLTDLLAFTGEQTAAYFRSLDPHALGEPVSWAGPEPAPVWLDLAREYTERWHHQQHIRDAVDRPGLTEPRYLSPVLDAFVRALPHTYRDVAAPAGTLVALTITGDAGGRWLLRREDGIWSLYEGSEPAAAEVTLDPDTAWRTFTKGVSPETARQNAQIAGDERLARQMLAATAIIA